MTCQNWQAVLVCESPKLIDFQNADALLFRYLSVQEPVPIFGAEFFDTMARKWNRVSLLCAAGTRSFYRRFVMLRGKLTAMYATPQGIDAVFQPIINKLTDRGL